MTPKVPWALHRRCEEHYDLTESPWVLCYDVTKIPWELRLDVRVLMKKALQPKSL